MTRTREENAADLAYEASQTTRSDLINQLYSAFERRRRDNGDVYYCLGDGSPEWMIDVVMACHDSGETLPDDWRYKMTFEVASALGDRDPDDWYDDCCEICDSLVDIYNHDRLQWLASNLHRPGYCDLACEDGLVGPDSDIMTRIGAGQYREYEEICMTLIREIERRATEDSEVS